MARLARRIKLMIAGRAARAVLRGATDPTYPGLPSDIVVSNLTMIEDDPNGLIAYVYGVSGELPHAFALTADASGVLQIQNGNELHKNGTPSGPGEFNFTVSLTDNEGKQYSETFSLEILDADEPPYDPGIDDETDVEEPPPSVDDDGFTQSIVQASSQDGLKMSGRNGGTTSFLKDWGIPEAGKVYKMKYSADWSGMSKLGRKAAVGFGFKSGDNFHMAGLRGNGGEPTTTMLASKIYGDFNKGKNHTVTDDGAASNGTRNGPNWLQITIGEGGDTYTLESSADGDTWDVEYSDVIPTPLANADDALQFGPAGFFASDDKGVFVITIEQFQDVPQGPVNTVLPEISGGSVYPATLTASNGTWTPTPDSYSFQWNRSGSPIDGATSPTYDLVFADVGEEISVTVTGTLVSGSTAATSAETATITEGDEFLSSVVLLLNFQGADGATSTTDESPTTPHTITFTGNAQIDTGQPLVGVSSLQLDGNGDYISAPDNADWDINDDNVTIELKYRPSGTATANRCFLAQWAGTAAWALYYESNNLRWRFYDATGTLQTLDYSWTPTVGQTYDIALVKNDKKHTLMIDGVAVASNYFNSGPRSGSGGLRIGALEGFAGSYDVNGHLGRIRITKAIRYHSNYTPHNRLFPTVSAPGSLRARVSQVYAEALHKGNANARVSQVYAEALHKGNANTRVSQVYAEALHKGNANTRVSQVYAEVIRSTADI